MIDSYLRSPYQTLLVDPLARHLQRLPPNLITLLSCLAGLSVLLLPPLLAPLALLLSGYLDTLDGTLARLHKRTSPLGTALDITSDRLVEFATILALFLIDPTTRGLPCLLMLGAILLCITSFLVVGIFSQNTSSKSFHYSPGLIERAEAFLFFTALFLLPKFFPFLAYTFALLVFTTALIRLYQFSRQPV